MSKILSLVFLFRKNTHCGIEISGESTAGALSTDGAVASFGSVDDDGSVTSGTFGSSVLASDLTSSFYFVLEPSSFEVSSIAVVSVFVLLVELSVIEVDSFVSFLGSGIIGFDYADF